MSDPLKKISELPALTELERDISRAWARDALWAAIADLFEKSREEEGLSYAALGRRIGRTRTQVQRWLAAPLNMTLASAGLLAEGLNADLHVELSRRLGEAALTNRVCDADDAKAFVEAMIPTVTANAASSATQRLATLEHANFTPIKVTAMSQTVDA